jgi:hypothetical protein
VNFTQTHEWQRVNARHIVRLAQEGDKLALRLIAADRARCAKPLDPHLITEWLKVADDYCRRDLTMTTRRILQDRYGHKIPKELRRVDS